MNLQDPDSSLDDGIADWATEPLNKGSFRAEFAIFATLLLVTPFLVFAGRAAIDEAARKTSQSHVTPIENTQTISLLSADRNHDPAASVGGGGISVVGGRALLSAVGPTGTAESSEDSSGSHQISLYVVREGDTLSQIAGMFDVSVNTIIWANDISGATDISPGDTLTILPVSGIRHTVEEGETLSDIVEQYDGNIKEVRQFNGLSADVTLSVGDTITIPDGERSAVTHSPTRTASTDSSGQSTASYGGYYRRPVNGGSRTQGLHGYNAVDIGTAHGSKIMAAAAGTVIAVKNYGWNGGYGRYVVVRHENGTQTLYAHNSENIVSVGQRVVQGQVLGYVGSTGRSTGSHVHFEIRGATNPF